MESRGSSSTASTIVSGATKRAMSSTCPCVSSPAHPSPSQIVLRAPSRSRKRASSRSFPQRVSPRISHLRAAQRPLLGHEQQTGASWFRSRRPPAPSARRCPAASARRAAARHDRRRSRSRLPASTRQLASAAQRVERPVDQRDRASRIDDASRRAVAQPRAIVRQQVQADVIGAHHVTFEDSASALSRTGFGWQRISTGSQSRPARAAISPHRNRESSPACPASRARGVATRSRSRRAAPTRRASAGEACVECRWSSEITLRESARRHRCGGRAGTAKFRRTVSISAGSHWAMRIVLVAAGIGDVAPERI